MISGQQIGNLMSQQTQQPTENQETQTLGEYLTQSLGSDERQDIIQVNYLFGAIINRLHLTLGRNQDGVQGVLLQNAMNAAVTAQAVSERALMYSDEVGIENPEEPKE